MRRTIQWGMVAGLLMAGTLQAAKRDTTAAEGYRIHVVTDRAEALYSVGDPVVFSITLTKNDAPVTEGTIQVVLSNDGVEEMDRKTLEITGAALSVTGTMDNPGFLRCQATYQLPSGKKIYALGGAGFDPEKIEPSLPPPDDFDAFWANQLARLSKVPMNVKLFPIDSGNPDVEAFDVTIDCLGGAPVRGYLARPRNATPGSLPALLSLHGAGVRSSRKETMVTLAATGILTMDINAHGIENGQSDAFYEELANG
ncbi:MAG: acetylxylan esterase, partial [Verrucomicrobiota bacterium]|nr:acetylxylan esterase [Verrucomicrobiota bacterium]